jgi:putative transposase
MRSPYKLLYLALRNIAKKWTMPIPHWSQAMQAFAIIFEGRVPTLDGNSFTQLI